MKNDGFRLADEKSRREVDEKIREIIGDARRYPSVVVAVSGSLKDRVDNVIREIYKKGMTTFGSTNIAAKYIGAQR